MNENSTKHQISSFAAMTDEDIAYFESLSFEEQRALVQAELDKSMGEDTIPWTKELSKEIFESAKARVASHL
ncbi:MAG: hypothetical protein K0U74_00050 [Alphaproteobacteria bacterium]|nr:hypothetical protein [Alphaproteobacteria bacterium]